MNFMTEQDRRVSKVSLIVLGAAAAAIVPALFILLLQSCEPGPARPAVDQAFLLSTQHVHRLAP
jgi:hypothetical protein